MTTNLLTIILSYTSRDEKFRHKQYKVVDFPSELPGMSLQKCDEERYHYTCCIFKLPAVLILERMIEHPIPQHDKG